MIRCIAIDDEPLALDILSNFCERTGNAELCKGFTRPTEALKYLETYPVDLIFLDIRMPSVSGLSLYQELPKDIMVIFTTAYAEYAVEGFNLNALDYLLKPFTYDRFSQAMQRALDFQQYRKPQMVPEQVIYIRADYSLVRIVLEDICYIEGLDDYVKIYTSERNNPIVARMTMKAVLDMLPAADFIRIHRSYILPLKKISAARGKTVQAFDKDFPIGSSFEKGFRNRYGAGGS